MKYRVFILPFILNLLFCNSHLYRNQNMSYILPSRLLAKDSISCLAQSKILNDFYFVSDKSKMDSDKEIVQKFLPEESHLADGYAYGDPIVSIDLDNDSKKEMIAAYQTKDINNAVFILVLKNINDFWVKVGNAKGDGYALDNLCFADFEGDGKKDILFGVKIGDSYNKLNVYALEEDKLIKVFSKTYSRIDIIEGNSSDKMGKAALGIWIKNTPDVYKVEVVKWTGKELTPARELYRNYFKKVVAYYEQAAKEASGSAMYWYYLADAQGKAGMRKEALNSIAKGISLNQDIPTKQQFDQLKRELIH